MRTAGAPRAQVLASYPRSSVSPRTRAADRAESAADLAFGIAILQEVLRWQMNEAPLSIGT